MLEMKLFPDLQSVHIHGRNWNSKAVLPLVLMSATRIAKLQLMNMSARQSMDPGIFLVKIYQKKKIIVLMKIIRPDFFPFLSRFSVLLGSRKGGFLSEREDFQIAQKMCRKLS